MMMHRAAILLLAAALLAGCAGVRQSPVCPNSISIGLTDPTLLVSPRGYSRFDAVGGIVTFTYQLKPTPTRPLGPYAVPVASPVYAEPPCALPR
jgi:hypothetical protein